MAEIQYLQAALFTRIVKLGEVSPDCEADYKGYERVMFFVIDGKNINSIDFPASEEDYTKTIKCVAALDLNGKVVGVEAL